MSQTQEIDQHTLESHLSRVITSLNNAEDEGFGNAWHVVEKRKYIYLDCGTCGAFMVERSTGELFNIRGYGKIDRNKKAKADIGNIQTVDPRELLSKRWNYLR